MRPSIIVALILGLAGVLSAQSPTCSYRSCGLTIVPTWNGLAVDRLEQRARVANLNFFVPRDVAAGLRGPDVNAPGADSTVWHSRRALRLRRLGATLTDAGLLVIAGAALRSAHAGRVSRRDEALAGAGVVLVITSVPFQFAADGALSRAVWWHNARYAR